MKNKSAIIIVTSIVFFLSIVPVFYTYFQNRTSWEGIVPSFVNDDLYYYSRMQNINNGYPFIGNPYYFEHRNEISPAFFVADWISTAPLLTGIPLSFTIIFNFIFWSIIFSLLVYFLLRDYEIINNYSIIGALLAYMALYALIIRPVSMQVVAPFFLLFYIAYLKWLKVENPSKSQSIFLIISTAISFYIYTYLWQIVVVTLGLTLIFLIYKKHWLKVKNLLIVGLGSGVLIFPVILYTLKQISSPYYWDTMSRIGLVNTHIPTFLSFYDSGIILVILFFWLATLFFINYLKKDSNYRQSFIFVMISGLSLIVVLFSNIITGKELEISNHIERFVIIWVSVALWLNICFLIKSFKEIYFISFYRKIVLLVLSSVSIVIFANFTLHGFIIKPILSTDVVSMQKYSEPLEWLKNNAKKESVVWSNGGIGYYIPIYTNNFQLFNPFGALHLMSGKEVEERYLVSNYFENLTLLDVEKDFRVYAGVGNSIHQYKTYNRKVKICRLLKLSFFSIDCGDLTDSVSFKGKEYFVDLYNKYKNDIRPNIIDELKKFNVTYVIKDKEVNDKFYPEKIKDSKLVWSNNRFMIYLLQYK